MDQTAGIMIELKSHHVMYLCDSDRYDSADQEHAGHATVGMASQDSHHIHS